MDFLTDPFFLLLFFQLAVVLGIGFRISLPWLQKKAEDPAVKFDSRFIWAGLVAWMLIQVENGWFTQLSQQFGQLGWQAIWLIGFMFGLGNTEITSRIFVQTPTAVTAYRERKDAESVNGQALADIAEKMESLKNEFNELKKKSPS